MEDSDFIFNSSENDYVKPEGDYSPGDTVIINGEEFNIEKLVDSKSIKDNLGFPATYSWYRGKDSDGLVVNLFFFDNDIDNVDYQDNEKLNRKWFDEYGG